MLITCSIISDKSCLANVNFLDIKQNVHEYIHVI